MTALLVIVINLCIHYNTLAHIPFVMNDACKIEEHVPFW